MRRRSPSSNGTLALDPRSVAVESVLASLLMASVVDFMSDSPAVDIDRAEELVGQALAASPRHPHAHFAKAKCYARRTASRRPSPNTRWRSRSIATGWAH